MIHSKSLIIIFLVLSALVLLLACTERQDKELPRTQGDGISSTIDTTILQEKIGRDKTDFQKARPFIPKPKIAIIDVPPPVKYCNPRFSFCFEYPADMLKIEEQSVNEDGIILRSSDSAIIITASAMYNVLCETVDDLVTLRNTMGVFENPEEVTVNKEPEAFTIKGKTNDGFFYIERVLLNQNVIGSCLVKYDPLIIQEQYIPIDKILTSFYFNDSLVDVHAAN